MCPAEDPPGIPAELGDEPPTDPVEGPAAGQTMAGQGQSQTCEWAYISDPGTSRDNNEDCVGAHAPAEGEAPALFVVADGMGGHAAGEVASRVAVDTVITSWTAGSGAAHQRLRSAARDANVAVFDAGQDSERRGMGSTLTAMVLAGREVIVAHVGDSRAYVVRGEQANQLTADHSRVGEMLRMRLITAEQAARHPARSMLTRCLGTEPMVQIDLVRQPADLGDAYVLCSDGLWDSVGRAEIASIVGEVPDGWEGPRRPSEAAAALVELALKRDAPDNVTVVVIRLLAHSAAPAGRRLFRRRGA